MRKSVALLFFVGVLAVISSCSPKVSVRELNANTGAKPIIESYNPLAMDVDTVPIAYTIDISTEAGRHKLKKLSIDEADNLAKVEAMRANKCDIIFSPQFTHFVHKGKVWRVTLFGYPARYKKKE